MTSDGLTRYEEYLVELGDALDEYFTLVYFPESRAEQLGRLASEAEGLSSAAAPPPELLLLWEYERYNTLPWWGGLMDQPNITMDILNICINKRDEVRRLKRINDSHENATEH